MWGVCWQNYRGNIVCIWYIISLLFNTIKKLAWRNSAVHCPYFKIHLRYPRFCFSLLFFFLVCAMWFLFCFYLFKENICYFIHKRCENFLCHMQWNKFTALIISKTLVTHHVHTKGNCNLSYVMVSVNPNNFGVLSEHSLLTDGKKWNTRFHLLQ